MAIILTEGFETYSTAAQVIQGVRPKWTSGSIELYVNGSDAPKTGLNKARSPSLRKTVDVADEHATFIAGAAFRGGYNVSTQLIGFYSDAAATQHVSLYREVGGALTLRVGGTTVATSAVGLIDASNWHYYELVATLADAGGTINLYRDSNATPILTFTGDTKNGGTKTVFDTFWIQGGSFQHVDDIYLMNGAGAAPLNARIGEIKCYPLAPNGNGTTNQGLGSDGNSVDNYLLVDEAAGSLNTADYVGIATDGQKDLYAYGNLIPTTGTVLNVEIASHVQRSDSGAKSLRHRIRTGGIEYTDPDGALVNGAWEPQRDQHFVNPDGVDAWTIAEVNAAEFGWEARP